MSSFATIFCQTQGSTELTVTPQIKDLTTLRINCRQLGNDLETHGSGSKIEEMAFDSEALFCFAITI